MSEQDNYILLNNNFFFNSLLARALIQLLPQEDRDLTHAWLWRLQMMDSNLDEMAIRNDYLWFLLLAMQYDRKLVAPFDREPPESDLRPLASVVPAHIYEDVLRKTEQTFKWVDQLLMGIDQSSSSQGSSLEQVTEEEEEEYDDGDDEEEEEEEETEGEELGEGRRKRKRRSRTRRIIHKKIKSQQSYNLEILKPIPQRFLPTRPKPPKGVFCYMAAFSRADHYH